MKKVIYCLLLLVPIFSFAQEGKWQVTFGLPGYNETVYDIIESYDKGYYLGARTGIEEDDGWHIKTDVNGNLLYDKKMIHDDCVMINEAILMDTDGNMYFCGTVGYDNETWPYIAKFDFCGERIWCKHFPGESQEMAGVAWDVDFTSNDDILILTSYYSWKLSSSVIYLICVDQQGEELWKRSYASPEEHPLMEDPYGWDLLTYNEEYYIAGECYYPYPGNPNHVYLRSLFVGIDSNFNEKWVLPFYALDSIYGWAESIIPLNDTVLMGAGIRLETNGEEANSLLMFINPNGEEIGYNQISNQQIGPDIVANWIHQFERINDSLFVAASLFGPNSGTNPAGEMVFDTSANLYRYESRPNTKKKPSIIKTYDENFVFSTTIKQGNDWDIYLYKIDKNLDPVPFDTTQHVYDSLCPHTIQSGEIDLTDCLVITSIDDWPTPDEYYESVRWIPIKAYPNPVTEGKLTLEFENTKHHKNMELRCYDDFGRQVHSQKIYKGQQDTDLDVSTWPPGIYIAVVYSDGSARGKAKFVVK
jgi:hypothetical protein